MGGVFGLRVETVVPTLSRRQQAEQQLLGRPLRLNLAWCLLLHPNSKLVLFHHPNITQIGMMLLMLVVTVVMVTSTIAPKSL